MLDRAGITSTGEVLSPATVRRLAGDAGIIPAILGTNGQVLDLGNAALLCRRHHTHVHQHDLHATITPTGVTWHAPPPTPPLRT